jgi:hypothetical protein
MYFLALSHDAIPFFKTPGAQPGKNFNETRLRSSPGVYTRRCTAFQFIWFELILLPTQKNEVLQNMRCCAINFGVILRAAPRLQTPNYEKEN